MTDFTRCTATELADLYRTGSASPVTVAEQVLAKIERLNPVLNAFCFTDPATTLAQAHASAQRWQQHHPLSELDGVPVAIKDLLLTQGWPTLKGSLAIDPDQPWLEDAPVVAALRAAGAVLAGKTTTSEFGSKITTDSLLNGITRNPWNPKYSSGGSSGGSAVAVSSGMVPVAVGSDYAGSIRTPAAFCGVVGFKPTHGMIPTNTTSLFECSDVGPLARSVTDVALFLNIKLDQLDISKLRIAYCPDLGFAKNINHEIVGAVQQVAQALTQAGAQVDWVSKVTDDPLKIIALMYLTDTYNQWNTFSESQQQLIGPVYQWHASYGPRLIESVDQIKLQQFQLKQHMQLFMESYDIILSPSTPVTADVCLADDTEFVPDKQNADYISFVYLFNLTHQPAVTVPVGVNQLGMPISVQIAGAVGDDARVLSTAKLVESMFAMPHPPLFYSKGSLCKNEILNNA